MKQVSTKCPPAHRVCISLGRNNSRARKVADPILQVKFIRADHADLMRIEAKKDLKSRKPKLYQYFESVWTFRENHLVKSALPSKYAFVLGCCSDPQCPHPMCGIGYSKKWFPGGPSIVDHLPIPVQDTRPCETSCLKNCPGHYKKSIEAGPAALVPSMYLAKKFTRIGLVALLKHGEKVHPLKAQEVDFFWKHMTNVKRNRTRGQAKAKQTREKNNIPQELSSIVKNKVLGLFWKM